ncbi:MAG: GAF domain-containing protein [Calditerrivibrio sp.]|nr:GAF domain-containing protein [Calditerrivibrio sp.]
MAQQFIEIVYELFSIKELHQFMDVALKRVRRLLNADAGSIFLYNDQEKTLVFKYTQNDSLEIPFREFSIPLDERSIAGYVGVNKTILNIKDAYQLDPSLPYRFNSDFDRFSGYKTKSMITIPLTNRKGDLIGVIQLINKKSEPFYFTENDELISNTLAGIVGISLENSLLYNEIENMWEGFIKASIQAIESRDPITRGHTERVTNLTLKIATEMSKAKDIFPDFNMDSDQYTMLKYACLLHDFGKIGVREHILQKAKKISKDKLEKIKYKIKYLKTIDNGIIPENSFELICKANEPTVLEGDVAHILDMLKDVHFEVDDGQKVPLIEEDEFVALSVKRGSLTDEERQEMEKHVLYTYIYLSAIPWTKELKDVPRIACMHHEKLDGSGYPFGLKGDEIHFYGRIMAIADIYDALTAKDRPYKKAVPTDIALDIIKKEAENNKLDINIVNFFIEKRLYE